MIEIKDKKECCGCEACVQRCPKQCIRLQQDEEGFLYPQVDKAICIECGLCEKVCPVLNQGDPIEPKSVFAAINPDEKIRCESSSGGVFTMLAEKVIDNGGVVFGAGFNEKWEVVHKYTETKEGLSEFRGSKYVQSHVGDTFLQAEQFLKQGREVLFSGTPCHIAGLKRFLRKDYPNLFTVDFICHGVPSPGVFQRYLEEAKMKLAGKDYEKIISSGSGKAINKNDALDKVIQIKHIGFRDKTLGWKNFSFVIDATKQTHKGKEIQYHYCKSMRKNPFLRGFLKDLYLRPSCHDCPTKLLKSGSDVTLGDFWGAPLYMPELDDNKGISVLTINTDKGEQLVDALSLEQHKITYEQLKKTNRALVQSSHIPNVRNTFFQRGKENFHKKLDLLAPIDYKRVLKDYIKRVIRR